MSTVFEAVKWPFGIAVGTAVGGAVAGAITPGIQELINEANAAYPLKPPSYFMLAEGTAKGRVERGWATGRAAEQGINADAFGRLVQIAQIGPGVDVAFELWRRGLIDAGGFARAVEEEAIDDSWLAPLEGLRDRLLSPAELANARQQEFIDDNRLEAEGGQQGYTAERMQLMFKMAGLPPGAMDGLVMLRRGIINEATYRELVAEGHTKTKYTDALLELRNQVLTPQEYASARLRQWVTESEAAAGGALSGYSPEQMDLLFLNRGRPASPTQMWRAWARGATGPRGVPTAYEDHAKAIAISDIRPEYAEMLWEIRFNYPSLFQLNRLATAGVIEPDVAADWAHKQLYAPEVVDALMAYWQGATGAAPLKWVSRAQSRLYTVAHNEYISAGITADQAEAALTTAGVGASERTRVMALWNAEREISRLELTPAEIRREYRKSIITVGEATSELEDRGMTAEDATKYLASGTSPPT